MPETAQNKSLAGKPTNGTVPEQKLEVDSTEIDPCLNPSDAKPKNHVFYEKYMSELQEKTGLNRKWSLTVLGLTLLVVVLVLVIAGLSIGWPHVPHMFGSQICRNPACLRAASQLQENLDVSISPCTNLWASVCSKYVKNNSRPLDRPVWDQKQMLVQKESERLRDIISTLELPLHTGTVEWKLKHFYEACLNVDTLSIDKHTPLTNIISELGGWYILRDWNDLDFEGMPVLTKLQTHYGISPFFKIHVEPDPHVPNTHSIRISPSGLGLPDKEYYYRDSDDKILTAYTDYIRDVVIALSSTKNDASKFGKDMFNYEKRLAEITPDLVSLQNPITTNNAISLAELKLTTNIIPLYDILQEMYPAVSISENTEVIVTSLEYLSQLAQIISSTDRRTMNGYLIWCLVRDYIPFLSEKYTSAMDSFNNELFGISKPSKRWELCSRLLKKYMALASEYQLDKNYPIHESTRGILNDTFSTVLRVVKNKVKTFDDKVLLLQHLESKLDTLTFHVGLPEGITSAKFVRQYYESLKVLKNNFFEGVKSAIPFRKKIEEKMLSNNLPEEVFLTEILTGVPQVKYVPSKNAVVVPRSLVMEPFFEDGYPRPVLYGRLGVEIAFAIVSSILPYGSMWKSDNKMLSPFHMTVNMSVRSVEPIVDCLSRLGTNTVSSRINDTSLTILKELAAIRIAHEALLASSAADDSHVHYGGLEQYEESSLYYLSFAQTKCSDSTRQYQIYENLLHFQLSSKSVLDLAWKEISDFPDAFGCIKNKTASCNDIF